MFDCTVGKMQESDIPTATEIWIEQYGRHCGGSESFPRSWVENPAKISGFLGKKVSDGMAVAVKRGGRLLGYMAYDVFSFNGEKSAFCPSMAHAAVEECKEEAYLSLYRYASKDWVDSCILSHYWTIFYGDARLKGVLYDLGFGSYVIDAFARVNDRATVHSTHEIRKAGIQDAGILHAMVEESVEYYRSAPLFLRRDRHSLKDVVELVEKSNVFVALEANEAIGFIHVSVSQRDNTIDLSPSHCGLIDEIGAYIKPVFRGKGVGTELLQQVFDYCHSNGIGSVHVDYETANLFANKFWKKHFRPMLLSVKRSINRDIV